MEVDNYDGTVNWALEEEKIRLTRGQGYGTFSLIFASLVILFFSVLILYYANRNSKKAGYKSALDMMKDEDNILFEEFSNVEEKEDEEEDDDDEEKEVKDDIKA